MGLKTAATTKKEPQPIVEQLKELKETFGYSVDLLDFDDQAFIHHALAKDLEMAISIANEVELVSGQMVRVTPVSYFRVKHD